MVVIVLIVKRPTKRENFLCQRIQYFQGFQPLLTKELNCEKQGYKGNYEHLEKSALNLTFSRVSSTFLVF